VHPPAHIQALVKGYLYNSMWQAYNTCHVMTMLFESSEQWQPEGSQYSTQNFATSVSFGT